MSWHKSSTSSLLQTSERTFVVFVAYVFARECLIGFLLNLTDKD